MILGCFRQFWSSLELMMCWCVALGRHRGARLTIEEKDFGRLELVYRVRRNELTFVEYWGCWLSLSLMWLRVHEVLEEVELQTFAFVFDPSRSRSSEAIWPSRLHVLGRICGEGSGGSAGLLIAITWV